MTALLELHEARVDRDGVPLLEGLSLSASGSRLGFVGDFAGFFELLAGTAVLVGGRVALRGHDARAAVVQGLVGVARSELAFSADWTAERYWLAGARLGGLGKRPAEDTLRKLAERLDLAHLGGRRLGTLTLAERRAVGIGLALLDSPEIIAIEAPTHSLDERGIELICRVVERAAEGRALLVSTRVLPLTGPEHSLFEHADEVIVLEAGALVGRGSLATLTAPGARYLVSVTKNGRELAERLSSAGIAVAVAQPSGAFAPLEASVLIGLGGAARFVVTLGEPGATEPIVGAALAAEAPIVELVPLSPAARA